MKKTRHNLALAIASDALMALALLTAITLHWVRRAYPMQHQNTVFFVLAGETGGHNEDFAASLIFGFIVPAILAFALYRFVLWLLQKKVKALTTKKVFYASLLAAVATVLLAVVLLKAYRYPKIILTARGKAVPSKFYQENYLDTKTTLLTSNIEKATKRNLITIFMESMETTYFDTAHGGVFAATPIPNLQRFAQNYTFFGGGKNIEGTSWTVAGLLSKLGGVPYYNPFNKDAKGVVTSALTKVTMLPDVLAADGYECVFAMGSEKRFESRDALLESHHFKIHDIDYYREKGFIAPDYKVFWGFEDEKLYEIAKTELSALGESSTPFFYGMLTVDTHFPNGFICKNCKRTANNQMLDVLSCADNLVGNFVEWVKAQKWGENTLIAIMGDHNFLDAPCNNFIAECTALSKKETEKNRRFYFTLIDCAKEKTKGTDTTSDTTDTVNGQKLKNSESDNKGFEKEGGGKGFDARSTWRDFSSFDVMPTILTALGYTLKDGRAALGVALQTGLPTLTQTLGQAVLESEIMLRTVEYEKLK